jgi:hypothetical protein
MKQDARIFVVVISVLLSHLSSQSVRVSLAAGSRVIRVSSGRKERALRINAHCASTRTAHQLAPSKILTCAFKSEISSTVMCECRREF